MECFLIFRECDIIVLTQRVSNNVSVIRKVKKKMDWTVKAKNPLWKQYLGDLEVFTAKDSRIKKFHNVQTFQKRLCKEKNTQ